MSAPRQLFVLRHAKSSWDDPALDDHERPLAPRGRRAVKLLADHVRAEHIEPTQVLCSSARRTRETYDGVAPGGELLIEPGLYGASSEDLIERLRQVPESTRSVMVIGHNPALQTLVLRLVEGNAAKSDGPYLADVQRKFPTGALATLSFDCAWSQLTSGRARLAGFVRPKSLR